MLLTQLTERFIRAYGIPLDPATLRTRIEIVRALFGFILFHRFLDIAGFARIADEPRVYGILSLLGSVLSFCVFVGFLTPLALLLLGLIFFWPPLLGSYLAINVASIVLWGLILSGAGKRWSLDASLGIFEDRHPVLARMWLVSLPLTTSNYARIRILLAFMFWGLTFSAMLWHLVDPFWLGGEVLQVVFATPFLSDHYSMFRDWRAHSPSSYASVLALALFVQGVWETGLPFLFLTRPGRIFACWQGLGFFLSSLILLNLGYLPLFEICWWLLVFPPASKDAVAFRAEHAEPAARRTLYFLWALFLTGLSLAWMSSTSWAHPFDRIPRSRIARVVQAIPGQAPVNVFNANDLKLGRYYFVLYETDASGECIRIAPIFDINGGRLSYLRNDFFFYQHVLRWQRKLRHVEPFNALEQEITSEILDSSIILDASMQKTLPAGYKAHFYHRELGEQMPHPRWERPTLIGSISRRVPTDSLNFAANRWPLAFNLPPHHAFEKARLRETRKRVCE